MSWYEGQPALRDMTNLHAHSAHKSIGAIIANGQINMLSSASIQAASDPKSIRDLNNMTSLVWMTYGDPSLMPYSATPKPLELSYTFEDKANFTVSGPAGSQVSIYSPTDSFLSVQEITGSEVTFDLSACTSSVVYVTGTGRNMAPFLDSINCYDPTNSVVKKVASRVNRVGMINKTSLGLELSQNANYRISIYSLNGRVVHQINGYLTSGVQNLSWNGTELSSGAYLIRVEGAGTVLNKRFVLE